jgi:anthranilate synthase component 1
MITPSWSKFRELAREGTLVPLSREILADLETPVSAYLKLGDENSFLLESVEVRAVGAFYSILGSARWVVRSTGEWTASRAGAARAGVSRGPLIRWRRFSPAFAVPVDQPPFIGGRWFLAYDAVRARAPSEPGRPPVPGPLRLSRPSSCSTTSRTACRSSPVPTEKGEAGGGVPEGSPHREVIRRLRLPVPARPEPLHRPDRGHEHLDRARTAGVTRIQKWIHPRRSFSGLAQRLKRRSVRTRSTSTGLSAPSTRRRTPYYFHLSGLEDHRSSPECLVRRQDGEVESADCGRPAEGPGGGRGDRTRSTPTRGAEHVMLVDPEATSVGQRVRAW